MLFGKILLLIQTSHPHHFQFGQKYSIRRSQLRSVRLEKCINYDSEKYVASEKSSWQDTLSQCGNTKTKSWRSLSQFRQAFSNIFSPSGSAFCLLFPALFSRGIPSRFLWFQYVRQTRSWCEPDLHHAEDDEDCCARVLAAGYFIVLLWKSWVSPAFIQL